MRNKSDGMDKSITFTLQDAELAEAYQFLASLLPRNKMRHLAIKLSIPILALFTLIYFHGASKLLGWILTLGLSVLWILKISRWLWTIYLHNQVSGLFKETLTNARYTPVTAVFSEDIRIAEQTLTYSDIQRIVPLAHTLLFFHAPHQMFILPLRVLGEAQEVEAFCRGILKRQASEAAEKETKEEC
ncbi:YcxB family protein [Holdemania massiliensis]|uniref:YcxB family protein n=1 Tax=Holdemania massiliensis TaxID=1468449 RepID=UPI002677430C|nr:YcxB family protein [Holdemania massiliensis]